MPSLVKFSLVSSIRVKEVLDKTESLSGKRLVAAGLLVEREARRLLSVGGGTAEPPAVKEGVYFYGEPLMRWVNASKAGEPPRTQTGDLKNSIAVERIFKTIVIVGPSLFYGKFMEFGTRFIRPRPFMRPALRNMKRKFPQLFRRLW